MDKREYLRSKGFTVGSRGRFSAEMLEALKGFKEEAKGGEAKPRLISPFRKPGAEPEPALSEPKAVVKNIPPRTDGVSIYTLTTKTGLTIRFDTCPDCKENVKFCHCSSPQPPGWLADEVASWQTV